MVALLLPVKFKTLQVFLQKSNFCINLLVSLLLSSQASVREVASA